MATIYETTDEEKAEWDKWVQSRCPIIQGMCRSHPVDRLYRMSNTNRTRVVILAYGEDRTVRVAVLAKYNMLIMERQVFGIPIDSLTECDLPSPDEVLGQLLETEEDQLAFINARRAELGNPPLTEWPETEQCVVDDNCPVAGPHLH